MTENKTVQIAHTSPIFAAGCHFGGFQKPARCMLNADEGDIPGFEITSRAWLVVSYAPAAKVPKLRSALVVRLAYAHSSAHLSLQKAGPRNRRLRLLRFGAEESDA